MLRRRTLRPLALLVAVLALGLASPASGIHLFPLVEGDPGGSCGAGLAETPSASGAKVLVEYIYFKDQRTMSSTTEIKAGDSVTWVWGLPHCHSVTGASFGTFGGPPAGFNGKEPELVRPEGDKNSFTVTFNQPGEYPYSCIHHASLGMAGKVVVK